jgi:GT2 family glycosyltransferase
MDLSYCVVNTNGRALLMRCLDAISATLPAGLETELLVLDNASDDGSVEAIRAWDESRPTSRPALRLIALERRTGKAENDSRLLREARGDLCLLLNEDSELCPDAVEPLLATLEANPDAGAAGAALMGPDGEPTGSAWRLPGVGTALAQALFVHRLVVTQSGGDGDPRRVGWVQSAAMLVRRAAAAQIDYLDPAFFVYSDETDFCKRLGDAGWSVWHVPAARAIHHEQLTTDRAAGDRRAVEFHRNRDLYMRKHHGRVAAAVVRALTAWSYAVRAGAALLLPRHDPKRYWQHARLALRPRGEGIRELAEAYNRRTRA